MAAPDWLVHKYKTKDYLHAYLYKFTFTLIFAVG
jgi:hypothetical protein